MKMKAPESTRRCGYVRGARADWVRDAISQIKEAKWDEISRNYREVRAVAGIAARPHG